MGIGPQNLVDRVNASAEHAVAPVLARAKLIGLPSNASRALEFPCGIGATTAAIAHSLGEAVGVDPSATSIESASLMHRGDPRCVFVAGGVEAVDSLTGSFDFAYGDLRRSARSNKPGTVAAALLGALGPEGMLVLSLQPPSGVARLVAAVRPSRHPFNAVRDAIAAGGGRIAWVGQGEGDSLLVYAAAPRRRLRLVEGACEK